MLRFMVAWVVVAVVGALVAAPVPTERPAKALVAGLSDPSVKVRDESSAALRDRADAVPWVRRATRSADEDTARRAVALLAPHEGKRQDAVPGALDACVREGRIDLLTEWHQFWKPRDAADLWAVGPRAAKAGMELFAKSRLKAEREWLEQRLVVDASRNSRAHDGPCPEAFEPFKDTWTIRTDRMDRASYIPELIRFLSVAGPARLGSKRADGGQYLVLGSIQASALDTAFVACDGDVWNMIPEFERAPGVTTSMSVVVCRGNFTGSGRIGGSMLLVDGNVDLLPTHNMRNSLIRASGEVRVPGNQVPMGCTIESHAKDATAPYRFFEVRDTGLSVADDEEGLVVTGTKPGTPFGTSGITKGDLIRAIDDVPAGHSESFRKLLRRAVVRQGDCLVTVTRGDKTIDIPVFFPTPK